MMCVNMAFQPLHHLDNCPWSVSRFLFELLPDDCQVHQGCRICSPLLEIEPPSIYMLFLLDC